MFWTERQHEVERMWKEAARLQGPRRCHQQQIERSVTGADA
jgi:hypothetical protein